MNLIIFFYMMHLRKRYELHILGESRGTRTQLYYSTNTQQRGPKMCLRINVNGPQGKRLN